MTGFPLTVHTVPLGSKAEVRLALDTYGNRGRVDLRTWADYSAGPVMGRGPTKKGVSLPIEALPALAAAFAEAEALARSLNLLEGC
jgi:hypothetical protein